MIQAEQSKAKRIFMDNAAGRSVDARVLQAMLPYFGAEYGNPASLYAEGVAARRALEAARERIAEMLGAHPEEIYFTSGGTESDNWALRRCSGEGAVLASRLEHPAVTETLASMEREGREVTFLPACPSGQIDPTALERRLAQGGCSLVALMHANHETGVIQPVRQAAELAHRYGARLFCDAVASAASLSIDVNALGVDALAVSGHKLGAPRGIGLLYLRRGTPRAPLLTGGGQQNGWRSGTESVAAAVGLAEAMHLCRQACAQEGDRLREMTAMLRDGLLSLRGVTLNGGTDRQEQLPGTVNLSFDCVSGGALVLWLNRNGICASPGSACSSAGQHPSAVLLAMGREEDAAMSAVRFSLSPDNTPQEVEAVIAATAAGVRKLRSLDLRGSARYPEKE